MKAGKEGERGMHKGISVKQAVVGNSGVVGTLVVCLLGVVAKAAEAWCGWQKAR